MATVEAEISAAMRVTTERIRSAAKHLEQDTRRAQAVCFREPHLFFFGSCAIPHCAEEKLGINSSPCNLTFSTSSFCSSGRKGCAQSKHLI
jgi:hypothetical protein